MAVAEPITTTCYHLFTVDDYLKMAEVGILKADERVELLEGIISAMSPIGSLHASLVIALTALLNKRLSSHMLLSVQNPIQLNKRSMPQPDLAIVKWRKDFYRDQVPQAADVFIVIEVSDTTLDLDRKVKAPLYAADSIPEYWIVDASGKTLEQYTQPTPQGYAQHTILKAGETVTSVQFTDLTLTVNQIFGLDDVQE